MQRSEHRTLCATKASRAKLTKDIIALAERCGAHVIEVNTEDHPRETFIALGLGPYRVATWLDGGSNVGAFMGHWHSDVYSPDARYPVTFALDIRGTLNTCHYRKATTCEDTFEGFLASLERGFESLKIELSEDT